MFFLRLYQGQPTTTEIKHICQFFLKHPKARERLQQEDIQLLCKIRKLNSHHTLAIEQDWNLFVGIVQNLYLIYNTHSTKTSKDQTNHDTPRSLPKMPIKSHC